MDMDKTIRSRAPLRISFAGGGTDVPPYPEIYGGAVISTTIDRYAYVTLKTNSDKGIRIISQDYNLLEEFKKISDMKITGKTNLIKAAVIQAGLKNVNLDILVHVDSPPGSGLGSSSALAVGLIGCLSKYLNEHLTTYEIAERAIELERKWLNIQGGYQDQYAATFGGFNLIEFGKSVIVNPLRLRAEVLQELLASMILVDTGKIRLSGNILKHQIHKYENKDPKTLEHLDVLKKIAYDLKDQLLRGNIQEVGCSLDMHWTHKRKIDKNITNSRIDFIYKKAKSAGIFGGKLLGAGGGGHMLFLCEPDRKYDVIKAIKKTGVEIVKFNFDNDGLRTWMLEDQRIVY
jgi:D-glycero-alpha-D-manno-heptose-7-phosphate kinase